MTRIPATLSKLKEQGRFRTLTAASGIDFSSNDYLGFKTHPELRALAINALQNGLELGSGGSRLLRGNHPAHEQLENEAANFFGTEAALFFANGFLANTAIMTALPDTHDVILFDALIHASLRDGIQSNPAKHIRITHNDVNAFEDALKQHSGKTCWVVVESVYSMDGDFAPLSDLITLCKKYNAMLVVDEAHATGMFGEQGKGLTYKHHFPNMVTTHTCGKGLGVAGALVCAASDIIKTLVNKARSFIYSTAPMPLQAVLVSKALQLCATADDRRKKLFEHCDLARTHFPCPPSPTPIIPFVLGDEQRALAAAATLQAKGFDIRAIRPPTVANGSSRLRITLSANLRSDDVMALANALKAIA